MFNYPKSCLVSIQTLFFLTHQNTPAFLHYRRSSSHWPWSVSSRSFPCIRMGSTPVARLWLTPATRVTTGPASMVNRVCSLYFKLGCFKLGCFKLGCVKLGCFKLLYFKLGCCKLGFFKSGCFKLV